MQWGVIRPSLMQFLMQFSPALKRRTVVLPQMLSANARLRDRFRYIELNPHFFCSFVRIVDVADHFPGTIRLLFPERCLPRISKGSVRRRANWLVWRLPSGTRADSFFFGDEIGRREGQNAAIAFVSAPPESWQIVGKCFFQRGSVTQKKWKSPHKHRWAA
jgi:hypothetical protein